MDEKSQDNQVIAHCSITQVLHTKCPAVVSYAERWHPTVTKSSSARKLLDSTKPVRMLSFVNRKAGFQETSWLIWQERAELKIQTKKAICTHRKVWSQVATKELRQSCPYFQGLWVLLQWNTGMNWNGKNLKTSKDSITLCHKIPVQVFYNWPEEVTQVLEGCSSAFPIWSPQPPSANNDLCNARAMWYTHQKVMYLHITHTKQYEKIFLRRRENLKH